jgi:hypothetical protein
VRACLHRHDRPLPWPRHRSQRPAPALCAVVVGHVAAQPDGARRPAGALVPTAAGRALCSVQGQDAGNPALGPQSLRRAAFGHLSLDRDPRSGHRRAHPAACGSVEALHRRRARAGAGHEFPRRPRARAGGAVEPVVADDGLRERLPARDRTVHRAADRRLRRAVPDPARDRRGSLSRRPGSPHGARARVRHPRRHPGPGRSFTRAGRCGSSAIS